MNDVKLVEPRPYDSVLGGLNPKPLTTDAVLGYASKYALREYQKDLIEKIYKSWDSGNRRIMLQLATGGGKTILFTNIIKTLLKLDLKSLVVAHKKELITQAHGKIKQIALSEPGYIKAGFPANSSAPIQIASIQTLTRRNKPPADLLVIDEAHHSCAKSYEDLFDIYGKAKILGVTATPLRIDGQGFHLLYDDLIVGPSTDWLIEMGYLSKFKLFAAQIKLEVKQSKNSQREYSQAALRLAIRENGIVNSYAIETWFKYACGKQTVVFAVSVEHSLELRDMYRARGIKAEHLDGNTPDDERDRIIQDFRAKKITVLTNCEIVSEGFDVPGIECVQCIRPTKSLGLWLQMLGRALRPCEGKEYAVILDHTFNYLNLGLPDQNRSWSLEPIAIEKDRHTKECKFCGHIFRVLSKERNSIVRVGINSKGEFKRYYRATCPACQKSDFYAIGTGDGGNNRSSEAIGFLDMIEIKNEVYPWFIDLVEDLLKQCRQRNYKKAWIQHRIFENKEIDLKELRLKEWEFLASVLGYKKGWAWHRHADIQNTIKLASEKSADRVKVKCSNNRINHDRIILKNGIN